MVNVKIAIVGNKICCKIPYFSDHLLCDFLLFHNVADCLKGYFPSKWMFSVGLFFLITVLIAEFIVDQQPPNRSKPGGSS